MSYIQVIVLVSAILLFLAVLNLVRLRRLREEYSWIWLSAGLFYLVVAVKPDLAVSISSFIGITNVVTAFIFFGLLFIVLILIEYSVALSKLSTQMKNIAQQIAILDGEQNKLNQLYDKENLEEITESQSHIPGEESSLKAVAEEQMPG
jgi:hypothetical protein